MHCIRCYILKIAKETHDNYHLGVAIFNMNGFESGRSYLNFTKIATTIRSAKS